MDMTPLSKDQVRHGWGWISQLLEPCVRVDPTTTMAEVYAGLIDGPDLVMRVYGWADGIMVFQITDDHICWVKYAAGRVAGGPKARLRAIRANMADIETVAQSIGCSEVRVCGRDWSSVLTDYELISDAPEPNLLRKILMKEAA